jgi:hypothetical protein
MKHVSIYLDDSDYAKLSSFITSLRSAHIKSNEVREEEQDFIIPQWQQDLVMDRINNAKPENYSSIDNLKNEIRLEK